MRLTVRRNTALKNATAKKPIDVIGILRNGEKGYTSQNAQCAILNLIRPTVGLNIAASAANEL